MSDEWPLEEAMAHFGLAAPVARSARAARSPGAFAQAVRKQLHRERRERAQLEARLAELERQLLEVRAEVGVQRRMADIDERLARVEAARAGLRAVS